MAAPWCQGPKLLFFCCSAMFDLDSQCFLRDQDGSSHCIHIPCIRKGEEGARRGVISIFLEVPYQTSTCLELSHSELQRGLGNVVFLAEQQCIWLKNWGSFIKKKGRIDIGKSVSPLPKCGLLGKNAYLMLSLHDAFINLCQNYSGVYQTPVMPPR